MGNPLSYVEERDRYFKKKGRLSGPCQQLLLDIVRGSMAGGVCGPATDYSGRVYRFTWHWYAARVGSNMEQVVALIKSINEEAAESKARLEEIANEVQALSDVIQPALMEHIKQIRAARMTAISEINQSLTLLRDLRCFFLESDYKAEMERLERFVSLCKELKALKDSGVLDAVADVAIKLAIREG